MIQQHKSRQCAMAHLHRLPNTGRGSWAHGVRAATPRPLAPSRRAVNSRQQHQHPPAGPPLPQTRRAPAAAPRQSAPGGGARRRAPLGASPCGGGRAGAGSAGAHSPAQLVGAAALQRRQVWHQGCADSLAPWVSQTTAAMPLHPPLGVGQRADGALQLALQPVQRQLQVAQERRHLLARHAGGRGGGCGRGGRRRAAAWRAGGGGGGGWVGNRCAARRRAGAAVRAARLCGEAGKRAGQPGERRGAATGAVCELRRSRQAEQCDTSDPGRWRVLVEKQELLPCPFCAKPAHAAGMRAAAGSTQPRCRHSGSTLQNSLAHYPDRPPAHPTPTRDQQQQAAGSHVLQRRGQPWGAQRGAGHGRGEPPGAAPVPSAPNPVPLAAGGPDRRGRGAWKQLSQRQGAAQWVAGGGGRRRRQQQVADRSDVLLALPP